MTIIPPTHDVDEDALWLFELANRIGFLILYVLLQALNPKQIDEAKIDVVGTGTGISHSSDPSHLYIDIRNRALLRDTLSFSWVDNALLNLNIRDLLMAFSDLWFIRQRIRRKPRFKAPSSGSDPGSNPNSNDSLPLSMFEVNQDDFEHLAAALSVAYPTGYYEEMDKIRRESGKIASDILENSSRWAREHKTKTKIMKKKTKR